MMMLNSNLHKTVLIVLLCFANNFVIAEQVDVYIHKPPEAPSGGRALNKPFSTSDIRRDALEDAALEKEIQLRNLQIQQLKQSLQPQNNQPSQQVTSPTYDRSHEIVQRFNEAVKYRKFRFADFDAVIHNDNVPFNIDMIGLMAESKYAADIAYFLGKNIPLTKKISQLKLPQAAEAILSIEKSIESGEIQLE